MEERETILYLPLHCHHQNDSCIKMGRGESHFNVSLIVRDKVTRQCPETTTCEEKGEPKRISSSFMLPFHHARGKTGSSCLGKTAAAAGAALPILGYVRVRDVSCGFINCFRSVSGACLYLLFPLHCSRALLTSDP